jgi:hypothetical protein
MYEWRRYESDSFSVTWSHDLARFPQHRGDRSKHRRDQIFWAVCSPSSCAPGDVAAALGAVVRPLASAFGANASVSVSEIMCEGPERNVGRRDWTAGDVAFT